MKSNWEITRQRSQYHFDNNFEASRIAESLIITAKNTSGLSALEIETYFLVRWVTDTSHVYNKVLCIWCHSNQLDTRHS